MSGESYQPFMAPSAHRKYKKFFRHLKETIKTEAEILAKEPYRSEELKEPLKGIRSYHFEYNRTQYRIAYRILEMTKEIEIVLIKSRESFYQALKRIL